VSGAPTAGAATGFEDRELVAQIAALLKDVVGEDEQWLAGVGPRTRLDGDLLLESVELAEFGEALAQRYGERVDLTGYVAALGIDEIIELTVADVAAYVASHGSVEKYGAIEGRSAEACRSGP
jgi:hypothetical protein